MDYVEDDSLEADFLDIEDRFAEQLKEREVAVPNARDLNQPYTLWTPIEDAGTVSRTHPAGYHGVIGRTVPNQMLERCVITPCVTGKFPEPAFDENGQVFTTELAGSNAEQIVRNGRERGTIYFECLLDKGYSVKWLMQQRFHSAIFPHWPRLPELLMPPDDGEAMSLYRYLVERREAIQKKKADVINPKLSLAMIDEMLLAVERADAWARKLLRQSNTYIDLDSKDANWKPGYDAFDMLLFKRTGMVPRNDALDRLAQDRVVKVELPEQKTDSVMAAVLQGQQATLAQLAEGQKMLAEGQKAIAEALSKLKAVK